MDRSACFHSRGEFFYLQEGGKGARRQGETEETEREAPEIKKKNLGSRTKPTEDIQALSKLRLRLILRILVEFA